MSVIVSYIRQIESRAISLAESQGHDWYRLDAVEKHGWLQQAKHQAGISAATYENMHRAKLN